MATNTRQSNLLVTEDWKKLYQTFRDANFQSYDFETLRKSMIDYLRLYYPEDFNDYIESSEFVALIDLIAFLGQSLAFRTDLNARENFIDTAERRDSILKLARLVSYNPKRNIPSSGYLRIDSVSSTEALFDSNGTGLANLTVGWDDPTNENWVEQFNVVLNSALVSSQVVGKPGNSQILNGILTEEYSVNLSPGVTPAYKFNSAVNGVNTKFEAVSATSANKDYVYEKEPATSRLFNILYKNDNRGNSSINTGFFLYFKQGELKSTDFNLAEAMPNRVVNINFDNVNNSDVWLYNLSADKTADNKWSSVPAINGINIVYNKSVERNLYQINTRANDQIDLVFGDGSFANVPQGDFRLYYRTSNGLSYKITPEEMQNVTFPISYVSRTGRIETLTVRASLQYTVSNAVARETIDDIRLKAPQQYYTQNRMITGEDYNILPYTNYSNALKVKAINRTSSGVSRFLDVNDTSGKYSSTNVFAQDGYLYRNEYVLPYTFDFVTTTDVYQIVDELLATVLSSKEMSHFYYANYLRYNANGVEWNLSSLMSNGSSGYFTDGLGNVAQVGYVTSASTKYIRVGSVVKFNAPTGRYFNAQNQLIAGNPSLASDKRFIYASIMDVVGDGTAGGDGTLDDGTGAITLNISVPTGAKIDEIIPVFKNATSDSFSRTVATQILTYKDFAVRYDTRSETWQIIVEEDINPGKFSLSNESDTSGNRLNSSWLMYFKFDGYGYTVMTRGLEYIFESAYETKFYFDPKVKVFDSSTARTINDQIKILKVNSEPDSSEPLRVDYTWHIYKNVVEVDGYENRSKILVTFPDSNNDGIPDNPDLFTIVVDHEINPTTKFVFFKQVYSADNFISYTPIDNALVVTIYPKLVDIQTNMSLYAVGQLFYAVDEDVFYVLDIANSGARSLTTSMSYVAKIGRQDLYFQYKHNSPYNRRIDPSPNNIIDLYVLTRSYETDYRAWLQDTSATVPKPIEPSTEDLRVEFADLNNYKAISDSLIYNSAKFKPLFGDKAEQALRGTFKVVKNPAANISDNDIKSSVIDAINTYFGINNWDFGETFYFSELSAYLHSTLAPNISSVVIVPAVSGAQFGGLYQINAEGDEIVVSAATVDNVEVISAITASQINQNLVSVNSSTNYGTR